MSLAHLSEWQRRSFDISSGTYTPEQKADAYRAHILDIQYAWASGDLSPATTAILLRTYTECYAMVLDSDDLVAGLNNYAESVLHLARSQKNESSRWKSLLTVESALVMPCVRRMLQARSTPMGSNDAHVVVGEGVGENGSCSSPGANMGGLFSKSEARTSFGSGSDVVCSSGTVPPSPFCAPSGAFPSAQPGVTPLFGNAPPAHAGNHSEPNSYPAGVGSSHSHQSVFFPSSSSNPSKRKFHSSAMEISRCSFPGPLAQEPQSGGLGNRGEEGRTGNFKTAREQLIMEHQKKQSQQPQRAGLSSGLKKSLGANRPRGTFSKFVSPLPRQEEHDCGDSRAGGAKELLPFDERLKNFEPKIIELILSEIMDHGPPVSWDDIAGLEFAKATIKEIVVWPMLRPDIFTGLRGPPKGILLFGPPGTGKTLIGKCIACQSGATFFSISASSLTSKWVGEGEKMVRALFTIARCHQPSVIFIDEIDSLLSQRTDGEHDSSRRIKTEFLVQLDGATTSANDRVLVVGATNRPQEIDEAARRRLAKRLYVPLPDASARRQIVVSLMAQEKSQLGPGDLEQVVAGSKGFSGADMTQLCREAALGPIRSIWVTDIATISPDQVRPILHVDFLEALKTVRPSVSPKDLELYEDWNRTYGCGR